MHARNRTWLLGSDPVERCRQRTMNVEGGDGSTLSIDFTTGVLDPRLTFTRSTSGTYIGSDGLLNTMSAAPTNDPTKARFDYDPITLTPRGLLIEGSSANVILYSQDFSQATWSKTNATATNPTTAPDGTTTAYLLTSTTSAGVISQTHGPTGNATSTYSIYVKQGTAAYCDMYIYDATASATRLNVRFTFASKSFTTNIGTNPTYQELNNGWIRISATGTTFSTTNNVISYLYVGLAVAGTTYYGWGAQLEPGANASSYISTTVSTGSRAADFCTMPTSSFITGTLYPQTLFVDCIPANPSAATPDIVRLFDRTAGGAFSYGTEIYYYGSSTMAAQRKTIASTSSDRPLASGLAYNSRHKFAISVDSSAFLGSYDGLTGTGTTTAPPALATQVTHMGVGCTGDTTASSVMFGTIRQIKFFPFAMVQSQLNAVTTL